MDQGREYLDRREDKGEPMDYDEPVEGYLGDADQVAVMTLFGECAGEIFLGKVAVGEVIRTRMLTLYHSDGTVQGTVFKPYQFSCYNTGGLYAMHKRIKGGELQEDLLEELEHAWKCSFYTEFAQGANLYCRKDLTPTWAEKATHLVTIGNHAFYRERV